MSCKLVGLEVTNFQPHASLRIKFGPLVNCIKGPNGRGKSSLIRAIRWVVFNRPLGDSVIKWGEEKSRVIIRTESTKVSRSRGNKLNCYRINGGRPFDAIGTSVPAAVTDSLRFDEINFQKQIDPPFWLTLSPSEVAKELNRIVDLEIIDKAAAAAASKLRAVQAEIKVFTGIAEESLIKTKQLSWVKSAAVQLDKVKRLLLETENTKARYKELSTCVENLRKAQSSIKKIPDISKIDVLVKSLKEVKTLQRDLKSLIEQIKTVEKNLCQNQKSITAAEKELHSLKPKLCKTCGQAIRTTGRS